MSGSAIYRQSVSEKGRDGSFIAKNHTVHASEHTHHSGGYGARMFGGFILAQAVKAASYTVNGLHIHSIHASFLNFALMTDPVRYVVEPLRDGKSIATRLIRGYQEQPKRGTVFFFLAFISFQRDEFLGRPLPALTFGPISPFSPNVEPHRVVVMPELCEAYPFGHYPGLEARKVPPSSVQSGTHITHRSLYTWWKLLLDQESTEKLDGNSACAILSTISDTRVMAAARRLAGAGLDILKQPGSSLDHAVYFHKPSIISRIFNENEWLLLEVTRYAVY